MDQGGVDAPTHLSVCFYFCTGGRGRAGGGVDLSPNNTRSLRVLGSFVLRKYICAVCRRACMHEERVLEV